MGSKIYTRKGDLGQTSLFSGEKVGKDDPRLQASRTSGKKKATRLACNKIHRLVVRGLQDCCTRACGRASVVSVGTINRCSSQSSRSASVFDQSISLSSSW